MKIGFIGAGNMGSALAKAVSKTEGNELYIYDICLEKAESLAKELNGEIKKSEEICSECDFIFLAVKPQVIESVLTPLKDSISNNSRPVIVSMAAGVSIKTVSDIIDGACPIIRIMPNTPVGVGEGMILYCERDTSDRQKENFKKLLSFAGKLLKIDEKLIDAASAVSGCGPAFVYMFIEALADGGVNCGLDYETALTLAAQTVLGSAKTVLESETHPEALKNAVCSPNGSTIEGVKALEDAAFRGACMSAVKASFERTKELGKK